MSCGCNKIGGEYIASGTYGCVFHPAIKCNKKQKGIPNVNTVGKIFSYPGEMKEEKKAFDIMKKIDPKGEFSLPLYGTCKINIKNAVPEDKIEKCPHMDNPTVKEYQQLISKFGGVELRTALNTVDLDDLIPAFYHLFKGLRKLIKAGYSHKDIKGPNILYNTTTKRIVFADYGLLTKTKDLGKDASIDNYLWWPPERIVLYILKYLRLHPQYILGKPTQLIQLIENSFQWLGKDFLYKLIPTYQSDLQFLCNNTLTNSNYTNYLKKYNAQYCDRFDIYSLGMTFIECTFKYTKTIKNQILIQNFLKTVIYSCVNPDPIKRPDIDEVLNVYEQFMVTNNIPFPNDKSRTPTPPNPITPPKKILNIDKINYDNCMLPESKGGYKITELRAIAKRLGIKSIKRKEICDEMVAKNLYKHKSH